MPRYAFTPAQRADIVRRYVERETVKEIAASYGCGGQTITRLLKAEGAYESGRTYAGQYGFSAQDKQSMADRYLAGETLGSLGRAFGCTPGNIRHTLLARGVEIRRPGAPSIDPKILDTIRTMRNQGARFVDIAQEVNMQPHNVAAWCRRLGIPRDPIGKGPDHPSWRGGRHKQHGYWMTWVDLGDPLASMASSTGYAPEHRLVMARSLGRPLTRRETVHHINGDKLDNRLENLQLRQGNHGAGVRMTCLDCGSHNIGATPL